MKVPMRPLPIETVYENNNEGSHFRAFRDSARIYRVIFSGFFRFVGTSMVSFLVDYGLYLLFNNLIKYFGTSLDQEVGVLFIRVVPHIPVSYTHLDVYKRQVQKHVALYEALLVGDPAGFCHV